MKRFFSRLFRGGAMVMEMKVRQQDDWKKCLVFRCVPMSVILLTSNLEYSEQTSEVSTATTQQSCYSINSVWLEKLLEALEWQEGLWWKQGRGFRCRIKTQKERLSFSLNHFNRFFFSLEWWQFELRFAKRSLANQMDYLLVIATGK